MADAFRGNAEHVKTDLAANGITYGIAIGRRQPMHRMHVDCLREIAEAGLTPVVFIGSTNGPERPPYNPIENPLTREQQEEQLRLAVPDLYDKKRILTMPDFGAGGLWFDNFFTLIGETDFAGRSTVHYRSKPADTQKTDKAIRALGEYKDEFTVRGLPAWESFNRDPEDYNLHASDMRTWDLERLTEKQRADLAAPDYVIDLARKARAGNPQAELLNEANIPVTMLDLSLDRLRREAEISTRRIIEQATRDGTPLTLDSLTKAAGFLTAEHMETKGLLAIKEAPLRLKVASASCNQTAYDFSTNVPNILKAIDKAVEDGADVLSLQEMGLTGYAADDYHHWFKNDQVWDLIQTVAAHANEKNPNLVISLGSPWHYKNENLPASDPVYNIENRPYNCQFLITGGKVTAVSAKSILAEGPAEYERHQFTNWPFVKGTTRITLPDGSSVPFGKPIIALEKDGARVTLTHEQCAEGWPGVGDDLTINEREQKEARHIVAQAKTHDLTVVINPSASKPQPAINKERIRADGLCRSGSKHCGVFVYTNYLGSESGTYAAEGSQIFAQNGNIIHHGRRYNFKDVSYSSAVVELPPARRGEAHVTVPHAFKVHEMKNVGAEAAFEKMQGEELAHEEYARSIALWLRDYMAKQGFPCQGFVISLSGGQDSAYGAVAVSAMVDLEVKENGVKGFFEHFPKLKYRDEVLKIFAERGEEAAVDAIKKNLLTCVYLPTDNSGPVTRNAAQFLIEGGELNGKRVKGIGGTFYVANVQDAVDAYIIAYSGMDVNSVAKEHVLRQGKHNPSADELEHERDAVKRIVKTYVNSERGSHPQLPDYIAAACTKPLPTWANPADDITMQNIQARARLPVPWTVGNKEGKIALVTSNESEAVLGYTTAGGDMHMGGANPIGGLPKDSLSAGLRYMQNHGLADLCPVESLHYVTIQKPTAELRKAQEGEKEQTDEGDLGFTYAQSRVMEEKIITSRGLPSTVHSALKGHNLFPSDDIARRDIIVKFCNRWAAAQFKRVMGTLAPYVGGNVDPHQSVRTTVLADHFRTDLALLTTDVMAKQLGGEDKFAEHFGMDFNKARTRLKIDRALKEAFCFEPVEKLCAPERKDLFHHRDRPGDVTRAAAL